MEKKRIVFFTGSGVSEESGIPTFRDAENGMWMNYNVDEVATLEGWQKNPSIVLDFHNKMRKDMEKYQPNDAHFLMAELEKWYDVEIVTQNIDSLHEKAGSSKVYHIHGFLDRAKDSITGEIIHKLYEGQDIKVGDTYNGNQMRYATVLFGDLLPMEEVGKSVKALQKADILVIVGTSLQVYPAASFINYFNGEKIYIIDPNEINLVESEERVFIREKAVNGMKVLADKLKCN